MFMFLRCLGEAVANKGLRALAGVVPFGDKVYDIAAHAIERYREHKREAQIVQDAEQLIQASMEEVRVEARQIAEDVLSGHSEEEVVQLEQYLSQIPSVARQSLKRPADPSGTTVPAEMNLLDPINLGNILPQRPPRFRAGDAVPHAPQWRFVDLLGVGGFGEVWLTQHTFLDQQRAVKFCLDPEARERLLQHEGEVVKHVMAVSTAVRDNDHGIVPLLDAYLEGESPWLAYEYISGGDLSTIVREHASLSPEKRGQRAMKLLAALASVIGRFHVQAQPIVHRDLKPANVLMKKVEGRWLLRVTDFGISHVAASYGIQQATVSTPRMSLGETYRGSHTPIYASPQQKRGMTPDVRDDVHALGVIGWQLLLGDLAAERPAGRWRKRIVECQLSEDVLELLESCWDDEADERPANAAVLATELRKLLKSGNPKPNASTVQSSAPPRAKPSQLHTNTVEERRPGKLPKGKIGDVITTSLGMQFAWVPPGQSWLGGDNGKEGTEQFSLQQELWFGGEEDTEQFSLQQELWCGIYPVTQTEWKAVMGNNPSNFSGNPCCPVEKVSWNHCQQFIERLNQRKSEDGLVYRLPTEQEWEYICRGGPVQKAQSKYHFYFTKSKTDLTSCPTDNLSSTQANFNGNHPAGSAPKGPYLERPCEVGLYLPNPLGIYDLHGNVWEWTSSRHAGGSGRMIRGGGWASYGEYCTASYRSRRDPGDCYDGLGFRLLAVPAQQE